MVYIVTQTILKNPIFHVEPGLALESESEFTYNGALNDRSNYQVFHFLGLRQDLGLQTHFHLLIII